MGPDDDGSTPQSSLGKILAVPLLNNQSLDFMKRPTGSSLHCHGLTVLAWLIGISLLDGHCEAFVVGGRGNSQGLLVDSPSVPHRMLVGQVHGVGGKRLRAASLFQEERRVIASNGPSDIGRHFALQGSKFCNGFRQIIGRFWSFF